MTRAGPPAVHRDCTAARNDIAPATWPEAALAALDAGGEGASMAMPSCRRSAAPAVAGRLVDRGDIARMVGQRSDDSPLRELPPDDPHGVDVVGVGKPPGVANEVGRLVLGGTPSVDVARCASTSSSRITAACTAVGAAAPRRTPQAAGRGAWCSAGPVPATRRPTNQLVPPSGSPTD
jgi:hypothetical protein